MRGPLPRSGRPATRHAWPGISGTLRGLPLSCPSRRLLPDRRLLVGGRAARPHAGRVRRPVAAVPRVPGGVRLQLRRADDDLRHLLLRAARLAARRRRAVRPRRPTAGAGRRLPARGRRDGAVPVRRRRRLAARRPRRPGPGDRGADQHARGGAAGPAAPRPAARRASSTAPRRGSASRSARWAPACSCSSSRRRPTGCSPSSPSCSCWPPSARCLLPESSPRLPGALASLRPQVHVPPAHRRAFVVALPLPGRDCWALGGLYASLGPSLVADVFGIDNHLVGGLLILALNGTGVVGSLALRTAPPGAGAAGRARSSSPSAWPAPSARCSPGR